MKIIAVTIFPEIFNSFIHTSILSKAILDNKLDFSTINPRDFATPPHFHVDDSPYGGGPGMVLKPEPVVAAIESAKNTLPKAPVIALTPSGEVFKQQQAAELAKESELIFLCGRYEGFDQRIIDHFVDRELSLGDFVTMGGEAPLMSIVEATIRLIPSILGNDQSAISESFQENLLEAPQYTKPSEFRSLSVPEVLLSGDHGAIAAWREEQSLLTTLRKRPDLLEDMHSKKKDTLK